jgi:hypothetical protein
MVQIQGGDLLNGAPKHRQLIAASRAERAPNIIAKIPAEYQHMHAIRERRKMVIMYQM